MITRDCQLRDIDGKKLPNIIRIAIAAEASFNPCLEFHQNHGRGLESSHEFADFFAMIAADILNQVPAVGQRNCGSSRGEYEKP